MGNYFSVHTLCTYQIEYIFKIITGFSTKEKQGTQIITNQHNKKYIFAFDKVFLSTIISSIYGKDKIYIVSEGICLVVKAGDTYELISSNSLDDDFHTSPVIVGDKLFLRGFKSLYCFE